MEPVCRAVVDVGTNSVKLLVAEVANRDARPLFETSKQTRLGRGFYQDRRLQPGPIEETAHTVAEFAGKARELKAASIRVIATSAAREAVNRLELTSAIEQASGLQVEILSGEQEADMAFQGVTSDPRLAREPLLLLDAGGGSTEFILGQGSRKRFRQSYALGTVRLLEKLPHRDPASPEELAACRRWLKAFLEAAVRPELGPVLEQERQAAQGSLQFVGTGGTASILGCMEGRLETFDRARLEAMRLPRERLRWHVERLWGLPLEERKQIVGLPKNRADVILTGTAIYEAVMETFEFQELRISTRGLRFAAVMS